MLQIHNGSFDSGPEVLVSFGFLRDWLVLVLVWQFLKVFKTQNLEAEGYRYRDLQSISLSRESC